MFWTGDASGLVKAVEICSFFHETYQAMNDQLAHGFCPFQEEVPRDLYQGLTEIYPKSLSVYSCIQSSLCIQLCKLHVPGVLNGPVCVPDQWQSA